MTEAADAAATASAECLRRALTQVTEQDLGDLDAWVPPGAAEMVRVLGARLAAKLITGSSPRPWGTQPLRDPRGEG